jgi:hypothetical protein
LNGFLSLINFFIENGGALEGGLFLLVHLELENLTEFLELVPNLFLGDIEGNEVDKDVGVKVLLHDLRNRGQGVDILALN